MGREKAVDQNVGILIADDFEPWRVKVRDLLQERPEWQILGEASDGLEAVQMAVKLRPDVVILDIAMPGQNGFEAARAIRSSSPKSRIIFLTEHTDKEIRDAAFVAGGDAYVIKSNAASDLINAIIKALTRVQ
ncbi:MAG TPA: response regulator transcription factor [Terriglobales bacterium]|nr:response regulator transcription factor [Terriglobales bacterium]